MTGRVKGKREVRLIEGKGKKEETEGMKGRKYREERMDERKEVGRSGWMKGRT